VNDSAVMILGFAGIGFVAGTSRPALLAAFELRSPEAAFGLKSQNLHPAVFPSLSTRAEEWQVAMEALILIATSGGPATFARIGIMWALNRNVERVFNPDRKARHWARRKLKRDT
jgi:hypothetical protein